MSLIDFWFSIDWAIVEQQYENPLSIGLKHDQKHVEAS